MGRAELGLLLLLAAGCKSAVETEISLALPAGDLAAGTALTRLSLELWPPTAGRCRELLAWRSETCALAGEAAPCPPPPARGAPPESSQLLRGADGSWPDVALPSLEQGPWDLLAVGQDEEGRAFLFGCLTLGPGEPQALQLWRPWCDLAACLAEVLPACLPLVALRCPAAGEGAPRCELTASATLISWEQDGVPCPPSGERLPPCHEAEVLCSPEAQRVMSDGVCPRPPTCDNPRQACSSNIEPLSCDQPCTDGDPCMPEGRVCAGRARCLAREQSLCVYPEERCNGADDDCDGTADHLDLDALAACNAERPSYPRADSCLRGQCACGQAPACGGRLVCRGGRCTSVEPPDGGAPGADAAPPEIGSRDADPPDVQRTPDAGAQRG